MSHPIYIQRKRTKGFNLQEQSPDGREVVSCTRGRHWGSLWANPYRIIKEGMLYKVCGLSGEGILWNCASHTTASFLACKEYNELLCRNDAHDGSVMDMDDINVFMETNDIGYLNSATIRHHLADKHLSCWCAPGQPCHVQDVLLPIARGEEPTVKPVKP